MPKLQNGKVIYTARTRTTGGREHGLARSCDGHLDVKLATPGSPRIGTNPEQLFAAAWSACFETAIALAARKSKVTVGEVTIDAELDLHLTDSNDYFLTLASTSALLASTAPSRKTSLRRQNKSARTPRLRAATSPSRSACLRARQKRLCPRVLRGSSLYMRKL